MPLQKIKILYIITKSNFGGAQRYVHELATNLPKENFEVAVACGGSGPLIEKLQSSGIQIFPIKNFDRDINIKKEIYSLFEIYRILKHFRPDVVHLNSSKAGGTGALIARLSHVPKIIFTAHGWPFHEPKKYAWRVLVWCFSWVTALLAHKIILVSTYDAEHTYMPFVKKKCSVITTAVSAFDFYDRDRARTLLFSAEKKMRHAQELWVVTIAELTHNKNIETAIKAVATYTANTQNRKIFYTIIGDGELHQKLADYIIQHNLSDTVVLLGYKDNARQYLAAFDIFLLPSYKEGMPYALLEAGTVALGTIASNVGGIPEIIENGQTGILVDPKRPESITAALKEYSEDIPRIVLHGKALQHRVANSFDIQTMYTRTIALYTATQ